MTSSTSALLAAIAASIGGGSANRFTDPKLLQRSVSIGNSATTGISVEGYFAAEAGFWTDVGNRGVAVDTNMAADTYKTILNVASGRGSVYAMISPAIADAGDTISVRITRDGETAVVIAEAPGSANYRLFLGHTVNNALFTTATVASNNVASLNAGKTHWNFTTTTAVRLPAPTVLELLGAPVLTFSSSILIEMKVTTAQTGTGNNERQAGVMYRLES